MDREESLKRIRGRGVFDPLDLTAADLRGAYLTDAKLRDANLTGANLRGAYLRGADLTEANLRGANLTDAYLTEANLTRANLTGANLRGADLRGAYLTDAKLRDANLTGANLRGADLRNTKLYGVKGVLHVQMRPYPIYISDKNIQIGCQHKTALEWLSLTYDQVADPWISKVNYATYRNLLITLIKDQYSFPEDWGIRKIKKALKEMEANNVRYA